MRKDEFIKPLSYFSVFGMLAVKLFVAIVFVFSVLVAGLKNIEATGGQITEPFATPSTTTGVVLSQPLPNTSIGLHEMVVLTVPPTQTLLPTNTNAPTDMPTATNTATSTATITPTFVPTTAATVALSPTLKPTSTLLPSLTPTSTLAATTAANTLTNMIASPLLGIAASELPDIVTQSFELPPTGEDSGHHGVDFAFWQRGDLASIEGLPIQSIFAGKVASAYSKIRNPYGYMVIVETPLSSLPTEIVNAIKLPAESQTPASPSNRLTCPAGFADWWSTDSKSLYVLYGHMGEPPYVQLGQTIKMGDTLGVVGNTGASTNPHLHLEMRIGPSNASFASMGHYDSTTTDQERHNYCMWRISGEFEMFDPMELYTATTN